jgi:hypothetical protein
MTMMFRFHFSYPAFTQVPLQSLLDTGFMSQDTIQKYIERQSKS